MLSDKAMTDRDNIEVLIVYGVIRAESKGEQMPCVCDIRSLMLVHRVQQNRSETGFGENMKLNY